jgi:sialidase-1
MLRTSLWAILAVGIIAKSSGSSLAAEPRLETQALWTAGEGGYRLFRIPGLAVSARGGTVLAYCEARRGNGNDWTTIDILMRRSTDGGKTWLPAQPMADVGPRVPKSPLVVAKKLAREDDRTMNNPVAIADRDGTLHFLYCAEYARCFVRHSSDEGETWSEPAEITAAFEALRPEYDWKILATGPGHGIQLRSGRLLVPVWLSRGTGANAHHPSVTTTIYSDDHARTWHIGAIAVPNTAEFVDPNETTAVELADGRVLLNVRSESAPNRRLVTTSPDGASGWSRPEFHGALVEPICEAGMVRLSLSPPSDRNRLLFANPDTLDPRPGQKATPGRGRTRKNVSVKLSYDEGVTWPVSKTLEPGLSGYSDLAVGRDGSIFCLYESTSTDGAIFSTGRLALARFNLEWLTDSRDKLR